MDKLNYKLYNIDYIKNNHQNFISESKKAYDLFKRIFNTKDSTWHYTKYNLFCLTSSSLIFYNLYKELNFVIRDFLQTDQPLWLQSWLNYHESNKVETTLKFHSHQSSYHGYICIDPKDTNTIFKNGLSIENIPGQIYLGPGRGLDPLGNYDHKVVVNSPYEGNRITIGFDIKFEVDIMHTNLGWIPLL
jgi:hypothetical protein